MVVQSEESQEVNTDDPNANDKKQRLRQRFQVVKKLGQGTYGKVQLAVNRETKQEVAVKTIRKAKIENEQDLLRIRREIQIMSSVQHPHIIHIYEVFENCEKIVLVMQYASGGELYDYLGCQKKLPEKEARRIFRQIAAAIYYCHKNKICHRDLKLENILLDDKGNAKIADFGLSNLFDERKKLHTFCGSPLYASPEIVKGTPYCGPEVDCWSLGVLLYTLVYGAMPFDGSNFRRLVKQIAEGDYYEPKLKSKASSIIRHLLTVDVAARATIKDICEDEWVNESYDHSLLKVANDLACLTPVSMNALPSLSCRCEPFTSAVKSNTLRNPPIRTMNENYEPIVKSDDNSVMTLKESPRLEPVSQGIFDRNNRIPKNSYDTVTAQNSSHAQIANDHLHPRNDSILNVNYDSYNASQKSFDTLLDNDVNGGFNHISNDALSFKTKNGQLFPEHISSNESMSIAAEFSNHKTPETTPIRVLRSEDKDSFLREDIPSFEKEEKFQRQSAVEKFRAWRANLEKAKPNESDSILPIFEVTSVIPKRSNEKDRRDEESTKMVFEASDLQTTHKDNESSYKSNINANLTTDLNSTSKNSELLSMKERKEVVEYFNQVCTQRKLSTELKTQFVSDLRAESKPDEMTNNEFPKSKLETGNLSPENEDHLQFHASDPQDISTSDQMKDNDASVSNGPMTPSELLATEDNKLENYQSCINMEVSSEQSFIKTLSDNSVTIEVVNEQSETVTRKTELRYFDQMNDRDSDKDLNHTQHINASSSRYSEETEMLKYPDTMNSENLNSEIRQLECTHKGKPSSSEVSVIPKISCDNKRDRSSRKICEQKTILVNHNTPSPVHSSREAVQGDTSIDMERVTTCNFKPKSKMRSCSVDNDERIGDLEKILRRPRKYSLCALLAASFEFERLVASKPRRESDCSKKSVGKVTIPKSFDPSSESEASTPVDKKEIVLIPSISVAENKQKMEKRIEKVKLSALSMKPRRKSEAGTRKKLKKYTRSCTDVLQCIGNLTGTVNVHQNSTSLSSEHNNPRNTEYNFIRDDAETKYRYASVNRLDQNERISSGVAENFEISSIGYVPITRCCKKITFPSKCARNLRGYERSLDEHCSFNDIDAKFDLGTGESKGAKGKFIKVRKRLNKKNVKKNEKSDLNHEVQMLENCTNGGDIQISDQNVSQLQSNESLNSSSLDKDSSDNDDDDDELDALDDELEIFDSTLETCASGDLWKFLKTINNNLSHHLKKTKRNPSKVMYSRSKSQECRMTDDRRSKSLIRSRSKEEKQKKTNIGIASHSSEETCDSSSLSDIYQISKQFSPAVNAMNKASLNQFDSNLETSVPFSLKEAKKSKYYSLGNLTDSHSFLYDFDFHENLGTNSLESFNAPSSENSYPDLQHGNGFSDSSSQSFSRDSIYGTIRPNKFTKNRRSQSYMMLNGEHNFDDLNERPKTLSRIDLRRMDKEHSKSVRNKALSDLDISFRDTNASSNVNGTETNVLRFSKSLGSKLNFEPRSILADSHIKQHRLTNRNKMKEDLMHKKRSRKVSFTIDAAKEEHSNFALESIAKAQKALNNIERDTTENDTNDEQGTLLEALKTHGYKTIMSQRLQQNDDIENEPLNRRYSLACLMKYRNYPDEEMSFNFPSNKLMNSPEYTKRARWNNNLLHLLDDLSNNCNDIEYDEILNLNGFHDDRIHAPRDTNWCKLPNMWLYQNIEDLRSNRHYRENLPQMNWDRTDLPQWPMPRTINKLSKNMSDSIFTDINKEISVNPEYRSGLLPEPSQLRSSNSPIEKLSLKIKALKNRCQQKSFDESLLRKNSKVRDELTLSKNVKSFDESILSGNEPLESHEGHASGIRTHETDTNSFPDETPDTDKSNESVSDRIWRKSFYSRFNDTPSLRRRRSMLFDSNFNQDPEISSSLKFRDIKESKDKAQLTSEKEFSSLALQGKGLPKITCGINQPHDDLAATTHTQNIPNQTENNSSSINDVKQEHNYEK